MTVAKTKLLEILDELEGHSVDFNDANELYGYLKRSMAIVVHLYSSDSDFIKQIEQVKTDFDNAIFGLRQYHVNDLKTVIKVIIDNLELTQNENLKLTNTDFIEFVNNTRLEKLRLINNSKFDLSRLIKLCEEINDNYQRGNYLSVGMIGRTILNHVPPIFGFTTFEEVSSNYGGLMDGKSFKANMKNLNTSLRIIADSYLHQTIRSKETIPNITQIEFRQQLDVLLEEIERTLK